MNNNKPEIRDRNFISTGNSITSGKIYEKPMTCPNCGYGTDSVVVNHWTSNTSDGILLVVIHNVHRVIIYFMLIISGIKKKINISLFQYILHLKIESLMNILKRYHQDL